MKVEKAPLESYADIGGFFKFHFKYYFFKSRTINPRNQGGSRVTINSS